MSEPRIEISDYLLGELSHEERAEAERLMRDDADFRAQVERLRPVVAELSELPPEAWDAPEPPPLRAPDPGASPPWAGAADAGERRVRPAMQPRPRWLALRPALAAGLSVVFIGLGVGIGLLIGDGDGGGEATAPSADIALEPVTDQGAPARGTARIGAVEGGEAVIEVSDLPASAAGEYYEIWLLNSPEDLVSAGSFRVPESGQATVAVPLPADPGSFRFVDISRERVSGDPGHSGDSVLRGST
jgi:anti-sigma-K factor RskA